MMSPKWDGKASAQRDSATAVLYMHHSTGGCGHVVFNLETQTKQITYSNSNPTRGLLAAPRAVFAWAAEFNSLPERGS